MSKLTIYFEDPIVEPIVVTDCAGEFVKDDNTSFALPHDEPMLNFIAESAVKAGGGHVHRDFSDSMDAHVFFDTRTNQFHFWQGDGDNKARGYFLDTEHLLPGMARIDVEAEEGD